MLLERVFVKWIGSSELLMIQGRAPLWPVHAKVTKRDDMPDNDE
jgi:hypothetical protein